MKKTTFLLFFLLSITSFAQISKTNSTKKTYINTASISTIQLIYGKIDNSKPSCLPNTILTVANPSGFGSYQWYYDNTAIPSATTNSYSPTQAGYYHVTAVQSSSGTIEHSNEIPVSFCPLDTDNDGINNNIDVDLDNDGIHNNFEAGGPLLNQSNPLSDYQYTGSITGTGTITGKPYYGFVSEIAAGRAEYVTYNLQLNSATNVKLQNLPIEDPNSIQIADPSEYLNSTGDFIVKVPINKTLTILNPNNALLIDTNYDGMYESGVTEFSSFEIRFRINGTTPLKPGILFSISSYLTDFISYTHHNLSDTSANKASFVFVLDYLFDTDSDGIPDLLDLDSDNDGIPDQIEMRGKDIRMSGIDADKNGLDDAFMPIFSGIDSDKDTGITVRIDRIDLDSDNDGIYDLVESGSNAIDSNNDGIIDGSPASFGANGLHDSLETFPDSGILNYTIADTDGDGIPNYIDLDSDGDSCNDVTDAGFTDNDNDGQLGDTPSLSNYNGIIISRTNGYTTPDPAYLRAAKILIITQPANQSNCEFQNVTFTIATNQVDGYQWQLSTNGTLWTNIIDNTNYSGSTTNSLFVKNLALSMQNYQYRVVLSKIGNLCGLTSNAATLSVLSIPTLTSPVSLVQCDDIAGGFSTFNLTEKNNFFSTNYNNEVFTYYTSAVGANAKDIAFLINDPFAYSSTTGSVWVRVENSNGCFSVGELNLAVSATKIPDTFNRTFSVCDDYLDNTNDDKDGITTFDFTSVSNDLKSLLPAPSSLYSITYYKTESDALSEINEITNISNYRNIGSPNQQKIWVRIENTLDNSCYGLGEHITLQVRPLPNIEIMDPSIKIICSNLSSYYVQLNAGIQDGTPTTDYTYIWKKEGTILDGKTSATLDVNTEGLYSVEVTSIFGCSRTRDIKVTSSNTAQIEKIILKNVIQGNTLIVNATVETTGQPSSYEYSLDNLNGPFQNSNIFENISSGDHKIFVKDKNGCGIISKLVTVPIQISSDFNHIFYNCDDYLDSINNDTDGISNFDFSSIQDDLISRLPVAIYSIKYYQNKTDALSERNEITNISNYRNIGSPNQQKIWVRIQNTIDDLCYGLGTYVVLHVTPVPDIDSNDNHNDDQLVCSNLASFFVKLNAGIKEGTSLSDYTYIWEKDGEILTDEKQATLDVNTEGVYTVEVISLSGCSKTRSIKVSSSNSAQINKITIEETNDSNSSTIIVDATGPGSYEYSLDNPIGPFQSSNTFENILFGIHDIYVSDKNGCGVVNQSIGVVGAPKFFTPNADGYNDYWNVLGLNTDLNKNSIIYIFDRYGKLIKQLHPSDLGWDGTFAGNLLPADDYWYTAKFENGQEAKGHFSLKR